MAVSNQLKGPSAKGTKTPPIPASLGDARTSAPASGLNRLGISATMALKSKTSKVKPAGNF